MSDNQRDASDPSTPAIPKLRGWLHAGVAPLVATGGIMLACLAPAGRARDSVIIYAIAGLLLFTNSAVYHRGTWTPVIGVMTGSTPGQRGCSDSAQRDP